MEKMSVSVMMSYSCVTSSRTVLMTGFAPSVRFARTNPASHLLSSALDFIQKNAIKGIGVEDVAKSLGISRRLANLRFQQFNGESINETITRCKLNAVKKLLATTKRPIKTISESCGYSDQSYLKTLFKKRFGMTMREWRRQNQF